MDRHLKALKISSKWTPKTWRQITGTAAAERKHHASGLAAAGTALKHTRKSKATRCYVNPEAIWGPAESYDPAKAIELDSDSD
jgi:hypothetical protein